MGDRRGGLGHKGSRDGLDNIPLFSAMSFCDNSTSRHATSAANNPHQRGLGCGRVGAEHEGWTSLLLSFWPRCQRPMSGLQYFRVCASSPQPFLIPHHTLADGSKTISGCRGRFHPTDTDAQRASYQSIHPFVHGVDIYLLNYHSLFDFTISKPSVLNSTPLLEEKKGPGFPLCLTNQIGRENQ